MAINWTQNTRLEVAGRIAARQQVTLKAIIRGREAQRELETVFELAGKIQDVTDASIAYLRLNEDRFAEFLNGSKAESGPPVQVLSKAE